MSEAHLTALTLKVSDPEKLAAFYCDVLGMHRLEWGGNVAVGYGGQGAALVLTPSSTADLYRHAPHDRYWKIAITLPDLDLAYRQLCELGIEVTEPHQFRDIAYMSHLADPEGHVIELIQHSFLGHPRTKEGTPSLPLGGGAQIGLITLRTQDIETEIEVCRDQLGMRYLSRQAMSDLGFDLYFLAFTAETPPSTDVNAVVNREWLWQRPYTVLEFQHRLTGSVPHPVEIASSIGVVHIRLSDEREVLFR